MTAHRDSATDAATGAHIIDPLHDHLIALRRLPTWLERRTGELVHRTVPYRWASRGIRGVRLPTILIGGTRFTSGGAFAWWSAALGDSRSERAEVGRA
ncbi:MAG: DUF1580 domain-containing protein [Planctomycetes bacterium]|nr:DUF1580 domain-containing protein [Planctomycetota bacterium]